MSLRPCRRTNSTRRQRRGTLTVEMAFVIPVVLLFFFGMWEWSRVEMVRHVCQNACFEGARMGTLPGYTPSEIETEVADILELYCVRGATVNASIDPGNGASTVSVSIPIDDNFMLGRGFFQGKAITADMTLIQ